MKEERIPRTPEPALPVPQGLTPKLSVKPLLKKLAFSVADFFEFAQNAHARISHLDAVRVDSPEMALAIETERADLLRELAFASLVLENLNGILLTAPQVLS